MTKGLLTLIPTPIDELGQLEQSAHALLLARATLHPEQSIFAIEDLKPGRRRWLHWKLPRESVDSFVLYNEHTAKDASISLLEQLKKGKNVYLMSDGGLPAFCDPGIELVDLCHRHGIQVTATSFSNSISLALSLSGFDHRRFLFEGFLPIKNEERQSALDQVINHTYTCVLMDTPYRLKKLLEEISESCLRLKKTRQVFLAMDLNRESEELLRGPADQLLKKISDFKREFILILSSQENVRGR